VSLTSRSRPGADLPRSYGFPMLINYRSLGPYPRVLRFVKFSL
jgi:hypothetical protein